MPIQIWGFYKSLRGSDQNELANHDSYRGRYGRDLQDWACVKYTVTY